MFGRKQPQQRVLSLDLPVSRVMGVEHLAIEYVNEITRRNLILPPKISFNAGEKNIFSAVIGSVVGGLQRTGATARSFEDANDTFSRMFNSRIESIVRNRWLTVLIFDKESTATVNVRDMMGEYSKRNQRILGTLAIEGMAIIADLTDVKNADLPEVYLALQARGKVPQVPTSPVVQAQLVYEFLPNGGQVHIGALSS